MKQPNDETIMYRFAYRVGLVLAILLITGCASTPSNQTVETSASVTQAPARFSATEQRDYSRALKQLAEGETEKAGKTLSRLGASHPNHLGLWINLANTQYQAKDFNAALETLNKAKAINQKTPEIFNLSGLIAVAQGDYKTAENHYLKALSLNKDYAYAHYNLALVYDIFYQKIDLAVVHYEKYLALTTEEDPTTTSWVEELKLSLKRRSNG